MGLLQATENLTSTVAKPIMAFGHYCLLSKGFKGGWTQGKGGCSLTSLRTQIVPALQFAFLWLVASWSNWLQLTNMSIPSCEEAGKVNLSFKLYSRRNKMERSQERLFGSQPTMSASLGENICIIYNSKDVVSKYMKNSCTLKRKRHAIQ